jgi:hypothetical protein
MTECKTCGADSRKQEQIAFCFGYLAGVLTFLIPMVILIIGGT